MLHTPPSASDWSILKRTRFCSLEPHRGRPGWYLSSLPLEKEIAKVFLFRHNQALAGATMLIFSICTLFRHLTTLSKDFPDLFVWVHDRESLSSLYLRIYESYFLSYCTFFVCT